MDRPRRTKRRLALSSVYTLLGEAGGVLKVPRKTHAKKDAAKTEEFRQELPTKLAAATAEAAGRPVRLWVLDEHRYGLLTVIRRYCSLRGVRVHVPYATRYQWGYLHEAMEVDGEHRMELLFTPAIDLDVHALFLAQLGQSDPAALHVVIQDQAGYHLQPGDTWMLVVLPHLIFLPVASAKILPREGSRGGSEAPAPWKEIHKDRGKRGAWGGRGRQPPSSPPLDSVEPVMARDWSATPNTSRVTACFRHA